jgi:threonine/homoserine/homoserine lactone efflux protein
VLPTDHLLAFVLVAFVLIVVPGPSVLFVVTRSLTLGRGAGVATVAGNAAGAYTQVLAVAFGLGTLVQESIAVYTIVKLVGAAYLISLGVQAFRHRGALAESLHAPVEPKVLRRILADGYIVGVFNPKVIVFFMAVLPQFVDRSASVPLQLLTLGAIFCAIALLCDSAWALLAGTARSWLVASPGRLSAIGGAGGLAIVGLGAGMAISGRPKS